MGNTLTNKLSPYLGSFLMDCAQGIWGDNKLTYNNIVEYSDKATPEDIKTLKEIFWEWNSKLSEDGDINMDDLEEHIYGVIKGA